MNKTLFDFVEVVADCELCVYHRPQEEGALRCVSLKVRDKSCYAKSLLADIAEGNVTTVEQINAYLR